METQLENAGKREAKLLEILAVEQEKTKLLMLLQAEAEPVKKQGRWLGSFRVNR